MERYNNAHLKGIVPDVLQPGKPPGYKQGQGVPILNTPNSKFALRTANYHSEKPVTVCWTEVKCTWPPKPLLRSARSTRPRLCVRPSVLASTRTPTLASVSASAQPLQQTNRDRRVGVSGQDTWRLPRFSSLRTQHYVALT